MMHFSLRCLPLCNIVTLPKFDLYRNSRMDAVTVLRKEFGKVEAKHSELQEGVANVDELIAAIDENPVSVFTFLVNFLL